jgi:7,8-dihydropterin-6-yl-methyl-4-(beta-D-ribofuranosyl)aminobenzene 5'-phosphate synthase
MTPRARRTVLLFLGLAVLRPAAGTAADAPSRLHSVRVLVLSTMLADRGLGEWGFSALVEADGHRLLFDTGARPTTVLENARELKVDLAGITDVVLSHNHSDHTGGLVTLRRENARTSPGALSRAYVGKGIFLSRPGSGTAGEQNYVLKIRKEYEDTGATFVEVAEPVQIFPGAWLTGPVPRVHPERNWSGRGQVRTPEGLVEDTIPEDMSLVLDTERGLVVITGCGHAGIVNTIEHARKVVRPASVHAVIGGVHLFPATDEQLDWTAEKLRGFGLENLVGAHCTGLEALYRIRAKAGLSRQTALVGAVGATFELGKGIDPLEVAR